jgi:hypothetical protein
LWFKIYSILQCCQLWFIFLAEYATIKAHTETVRPLIIFLKKMFNFLIVQK